MNDEVVPALRLERDGEATFQVAATETADVGRSSDADVIVADDPHVSGVHFRLLYRDASWWLLDLESRNGTFLNDHRVTEPSVIHDGDRVLAGSTTFLIRFDPGAQAVDSQSDPLADTTEAEAPTPGPAHIANTTPFVVGTVYHEDANHRAWLTIVVKATWTIEAKPRIAPNPIPIFVGDQMESDEPTASVRFETDLVPFKPCADIVLVGRAHAPAGEPVTQLLAGLKVGDRRHLVAVIGDRAWQWRPNGPPTVTDPKPFRAMDLVYERAFGGIDGPGAMYCQENLVGTGFVGKLTRERVDGLRLPNLEDPRNLITDCDTHPTPIGFGFYGRGWRPRLTYAGTYDDAYVLDRYPLPPVDFSHRFFNGAAPDLQVEGYLAGNEDVALLNVCPDEPEVRFRLPGVVPKILVSRYSVPPDRWLDEHADDAATAEIPRTSEEIPTVLDTLVFVPDEGVFYQVFRGMCRLSSLEALEIASIAVST